MALGLVGRKVGMPRLYTAEGVGTPVTVIEVTGNRVTQVKNREKDGYAAVQITAGTRRADRVGKALAGKFAKAGVEPCRGLWEFRLGANEGAELKLGAEIKVDLFAPGQFVDVQGTSIGKGFAGPIKPPPSAGGRASHGTPLSHRAPGSIGQRQTPGRVFPGKPMAGHPGAATATRLNLEGMQVDAERKLLMLKGAVPGPKGLDVVIRPSVKTRKSANVAKPK